MDPSTEQKHDYRDWMSETKSKWGAGQKDEGGGGILKLGLGG